MISVRVGLVSQTATSITNQNQTNQFHCNSAFRSQVVEQVTCQGVLLRPREHCPQPIYELMLACWKSRPSQRMAMRNVHARLRHLCATTDTVEYLELGSDSRRPRESETTVSSAVQYTPLCSLLQTIKEDRKRVGITTRKNNVEA